jgi:hypothetical protein
VQFPYQFTASFGRAQPHTAQTNQWFFAYGKATGIAVGLPDLA